MLVCPYILLTTPSLMYIYGILTFVNQKDALPFSTKRAIKLE